MVLTGQINDNRALNLQGKERKDHIREMYDELKH